MLERLRVASPEGWGVSVRCVGRAFSPCDSLDSRAPPPPPPSPPSPGATPPEVEGWLGCGRPRLEGDCWKLRTTSTLQIK